MYSANESIDTAYNYIQSEKAKGYKYNGYPVYNVSKDDLNALKNITDKYGIPFEWMINLINHESAGTFNPAIKNSIGATGLIQFLKSTATSLGTTTDELSKMTFKQQLAYVDKYLYANLRNHLTSEGKIPNTFTQGDIFMTIFYPNAIGKPDYKFSDKVTQANDGIKTPMDYVEKALETSVFPLSIFPYSLADVKKKIGISFQQTGENIKNVFNQTKSNLLPASLIGIGTIGLIFSLFNWKKIFA